MSRKMTKSDLSRTDISLLINSEEAKNTQLYGNLYDVLLQIKDLKAITLEELENCNLNYYGMSALSYNKHTLIDNTTKEWRATTDIIDNPKRTAVCQLCNAPRLRYECHIRNIKNNTELLVGSECVNHFKIDGYINQKKQLAQIHKGHKIVQRRNEFYSHFSDYEDFISDAEKYFSTLPILLPYELYTNLHNTIERMRLIATKYVNEGKKPYDSQYDSFGLFQLAINNYTKLKINSDIYVSKNVDKKLVCKRLEIDWMIAQNKKKLLQQISENNGFYTISTLRNIYSLEFVQSYIQLIISKNNSDIMKFEGLNDNSVTFSFNKFGYQTPILFSIQLKDFMQYIGADCIVNDDFTYSSKNILSISNIVFSNNNLVSILEYIDNMTNLLNCVFLIDDLSDTLYLYRKGDKSVRRFSKYTFMQNYSRYMVLSDEDIKKYLIYVIKEDNNAKWITTEMQAKQGIDDKIGILYKGYRESHEYIARPMGQIFEIMTYNVRNNSVTNTAKIDFDSSEFISLQRNKLKIGDSQLRFAEYGLRIGDESLSPFYHSGDILFIQPIQKFKEEATVLFASKYEVVIKKCYSEKKESENIFCYTNIPKKELVAYGKILYCLHNENKSKVKSSQKEEVKQKLSLNKVDIFVVGNPKVCPACFSKCTYKLIKYIQENKKSRQINVAVCPKCNKYYVDKNSYLTYMKSKKETNLEFLLSK